MESKYSRGRRVAQGGGGAGVVAPAPPLATWAVAVACLGSHQNGTWQIVPQDTFWRDT